MSNECGRQQPIYGVKPKRVAIQTEIGSTAKLGSQNQSKAPNTTKVFMTLIMKLN